MSNLPPQEEGVITILLVDDIPETRENIKRLLSFEPDFKVIGSAGTGTEGVALAKELRPDIIIMDINMPDMDGITATKLIDEAVPTAAVIMMSVQDDPDYLRQAMQAGARNFLTKPIDPDQLYSTIRTVYERHRSVVDRFKQFEVQPSPTAPKAGKVDGEGGRPGHVIVLYSPQGGSGCTTVATNLASGLMKEGIRVLLVDADLQFGDVGVFLNLQSQSSLVDLVGKVDDLDVEFFDNIVVTHDSGLKVLLGPARPEYAEEVRSRPGAVAEILRKVASNYDFVVVDTSRYLDDVLIELMDLAAKVILVATPTLAAVKNLRFVLDLFDRLEYPPNKTMLVLNRTQDERQQKGRITIPVSIIEKHLKRPVEAQIPLDERTILSAVNRGIPVIAAVRDRNRSPAKEFLDLADRVYEVLVGAAEAQKEGVEGQTKAPGLAGLLRRR